MKSDSSPERDQAHDYDITREPEVTDDNKKRKRKPYRPGEEGLSQSHLYLSLPGSLCIFISSCLSSWVSGIGGFMVRQRGGKTGLSRIKLCRRDSSELPGRAEGETEPTPKPSSAHLFRMNLSTSFGHSLTRCYHGDGTPC